MGGHIIPDRPDVYEAIANHPTLKQSTWSSSRQHRFINDGVEYCIIPASKCTMQHRQPSSSHTRSSALILSVPVIVLPCSKQYPKLVQLQSPINLLHHEDTVVAVKVPHRWQASSGMRQKRIWTMADLPEAYYSSGDIERIMQCPRSPMRELLSFSPT